MHKPALVILLLAALLTGCSSSNVCMQKTDTALHATLHRVRYDQAGERYIAEQTQVTASVHGLGLDSLIYRSATTSEFTLPLNPAAEASSFVVEQLSADSVTIIDTITILHDNSLKFISLECGAAKLFTVTRVEHTLNGIDSVVTDNAVVDLAGLNNLKIYVRQ